MSVTYKSFALMIILGEFSMEKLHLVVSGFLTSYPFILSAVPVPLCDSTFVISLFVFLKRCRPSVPRRARTAGSTIASFFILVPLVLASDHC